ncbi:MAG: cell division protein FtsZ [Gemmatimonadota bacterium]
MVFEFDDNIARNARMKVVGVGGAGGNAVNRMIDEQLEGVEFIAVNTDSQSLKESESHIKIQIGKRLTRGLGAGARPEIGRQAMAETEDEVRTALQGADLVFVTAGMGGGTGTGSAPVIGRMAREMGALCIAIVTRPFHFEGKKRMRHAEMGLRELRRAVDTMIVVPNERLLAVVGKDTTFREALKTADKVLLHATQGISDLISVTGDVNVDFADVRTVMSNRGAALMGTGRASGDDRAVDAAQQAICSPLLDNVSINGATGVLVNITGGADLTIDEVTTINSIIQEAAGEEGEMIFGVVHDPLLENSLRVTVIATGFGEPVEDDEPIVVRPPMQSPPMQSQTSQSQTTRSQPTQSQPTQSERPGEIRTEPIVIGSRYEGPQLVEELGAAQAAAAKDEKWTDPAEEFEDLEIPTFIRRQMD